MSYFDFESKNALTQLDDMSSTVLEKIDQLREIKKRTPEQQDELETYCNLHALIGSSYNVAFEFN